MNPLNLNIGDNMSNEYFEGTRIIEHEDGSVTHITYEHEPYTEPLTWKESAALLTGLFGFTGVVVAAPFLLEKVYDWTSNRSEIKQRQKKNRALFDTMKNN